MGRGWIGIGGKMVGTDMGVEVGWWFMLGEVVSAFGREAWLRVGGEAVVIWGDGGRGFEGRQ